MSSDVLPEKVREIPVVYQAIRDRDRADGIVGKLATVTEQGELHSLDVTALVDRSRNIAGDCSDHVLLTTSVEKASH